MDNKVREIDATCLCGNAKHTVTLPEAKYPLKAYLCHCTSCRHMTGTLCWSVAFLPTVYRPQQPLLERLKLYDCSKRIQVYFCPTCGTNVMARVVAEPSDPRSVVLWGLSTGTIAQADGVFEIQGHEHIEDTLDGGFADFFTELAGKHVPRWPGHFAEGLELSRSWKSQLDAGELRIDAPSNRVHGHCKCGGVEFWVSRPSERSAHVKAPGPDLLVPSHAGAPLLLETEKWWLCDNRTKYLSGLCSCNSCRLASGCEWVEWAFVPTVDISLDAAGKIPFQFDFGSLKEYRSSAEARRYFCNICGAMIFWDGDDRQMLKDVAVGLLDAPEGARAESLLEWRTWRLSHREDAIGRAESLTLAVEHGLQEYGKRRAQAA